MAKNFVLYLDHNENYDLGRGELFIKGTVKEFDVAAGDDGGIPIEITFPPEMHAYALNEFIVAGYQDNTKVEIARNPVVNNETGTVTILIVPVGSE